MDKADTTSNAGMTPPKFYFAGLNLWRLNSVPGNHGDHVAYIDADTRRRRQCRKRPNRAYDGCIEDDGQDDDET